MLLRIPPPSWRFPEACACALDLIPAFVRELDGTIRCWTSGAERLYGWPASSALGRSAHEVLRTEFPQPLDKINSELLTNGSWSGLLRHMRQDGSAVTVASSWILLHRERSFAVVEHNEEIRSLHRAPSEADYERLAHLNEDLEHFTFAAAHDLQEPLRTIRMFAELLRLENAGQRNHHVEMIVGAADRMQALLRELMRYVESVKCVPAAGESADGNHVCHLVLQNLQELVETAQAEVTMTPLPSVAMDPVRLTQIFQNLLSNAVKYRSPERPLKVQVSATASGAKWIFAVADNGLGISSEFHQSIFQGFKRLHGNKIPGTGLGLALCKRLVEQYGGRIWLESQEGAGSTFYFELPAAI